MALRLLYRQVPRRRFKYNSAYLRAISMEKVEGPWRSRQPAVHLFAEPSRKKMIRGMAFSKQSP